MAATPPPPLRLRSPPTPRHGAGYDSYQPYSTRHSARLAARESHITPPPFSPQKNTRKQRPNDVGTLSPPGSATSSPRKNSSGRTRNLVPVNDNPFLDVTDPSGDLGSSALRPSSQLPTFTSSTMLPTPAKTPRKKTIGHTGTAARTLFPTASDSLRPKKGKKFSGFSLESFHEDTSENHENIEIFTDSRDRVPKMDESEENPFHKMAEGKRTPNNNPRTTKRRKVDEAKCPAEETSERPQDDEDVLKRDDGMLYVFRGRKMFRKFRASNDDEEESDGDDLGLFAERPDLLDDSINLRVRPLTRSSIKPRVLFPTTHKSITEDAHLTADEEATTDIDEHVEVHQDEDASHAEAELNLSQGSAPVKPTVRSLRSRPGLHRDGTPPVPEGRKKKRFSPFDGWMRKKQTPSPGTELNTSKKREGEPIPGASGPAAKKTRAK